MTSKDSYSSPNTSQDFDNRGYSNQAYPQQGYPMQGQAYNQQSSNTNVVVAQQPTSNVIITSRPSDYFGFALFTCLCCFWPTGIAALIFSCNSKSAADRMDFAQAQSDGNTAKIFSIVSLVIGLIWMIALAIYLIVFFVVLASVVSSSINNINYG